MTIIFVEFGVILLLLVANGVFAMTEMAVVSARKSRLRLMADEGDVGARAALSLAESPNRFLPSVQIGITLIGLLAGAFGGATLAKQIATWLVGWPSLAPYAEVLGVAAVVVALTFLSLVIGELVPKRLALADPERIASRMAQPLDWLSRLARPAIWVLGQTTDLVLRLLCVPPRATGNASEDEVKLLMHEGTRSGVFHPAEPRMVESVLAFDQRPVTDIMTPRGKVIFLRRDEKPEVLWHKIVVAGHSSYPVHEGNRDRIVGVVSVKSIYANLAAGVNANVADLMVQPLCVPASQSIAALLETFKRGGKHIAIVADERNVFLGLVTLVDVLEAIVGEIPSLEERLQPEARRREDGSWLVDGRLALTKFRRLLPGGSNLEDYSEPKQTVAGFVAARLGKGTSEGDVLTTDGWQYEVLDLDGDRIDKLLVTHARRQS